MTLSQQCVNLELAKRLKELNVKQDSLFYWYFRIISGPIKAKGNSLSGGGEIKKWLEEDVDISTMPDIDKYSAFTVAELGEMLTKRFDPFDSSLETTSVPVFGGLEWVWYQNGDAIVRGDTEADARAKCLIYLLENKLIDNV